MSMSIYVNLSHLCNQLRQVDQWSIYDAVWVFNLNIPPPVCLFQQGSETRVCIPNRNGLTTELIFWGGKKVVNNLCAVWHDARPVLFSFPVPSKIFTLHWILFSEWVMSVTWLTSANSFVHNYKEASVECKKGVGTSRGWAWHVVNLNNYTSLFDFFFIPYVFIY